MQTSELHQTRKAMQRAIGHAFNMEELNAIISMPDNLDKFRFDRFSPLGEGKNINDPKDINNIQKKQKRGVTGYNVYSATINGVEWIIKTEVFKNKSEMIYHIMKKR